MPVLMEWQIGFYRPIEIYDMNIVELFYFLGFIGSALVGGLLLGRHFGTFVGCIGAGLGLICWGGLFWKIADKRFMIGRPPCRLGKCSDSKGYSFVKIIDGKAQYQCRCGDKYILDGNRFLILNEKGIAQPYMKRKHAFAKWQIETQQSGSKVSVTPSAK